MANAIATENQNTGDTGWQIAAGNTSTTQIQGYVSACSVDPGGSLSVYVSTQVASTTYSIKVYRVGWYGGTGGRLMLSVTGQVGQAQGYFQNSDLTLHNASSSFTDGTTGLCEARFTSSYTLNIGSNWCTGCYLILFTDANGLQSYAHFVVRCPSNTDYVVVRPDMTYAAYNNWGCKSLYSDSSSTNNVGAVKVSFDRPSTNYRGGDQFVYNDLAFIHWIERMGYDIGYLSDIDVHVNGSSILTSHKAYISMGHDEYWSFEKRAAVESALSSGVSCAFMGGNSCYWQVRLESGGQNGANRTVTCYKVASIPNTLSTDPEYGVDNTRITTNWRDPILARPESTLIGIMYSGLATAADGSANVGWKVDASATSTYLNNTGLTPGSIYGTDIVGQEWDRVMRGSPANIQIIATSPTTTATGPDISNTTIYIAPSGALVFATGSYSWQWALDNYRYYSGLGSAVLQVQRFMANIMTALIRPQKPTGFNTFSVHI